MIPGGHVKTGHRGSCQNRTTGHPVPHSLRSATTTSTPASVDAAKNEPLFVFDAANHAVEFHREFPDLTGNLLRKYSFVTSLDGSRPLTAAAFTADGNRVLAAYGSTAILWSWEQSRAVNSVQITEANSDSAVIADSAANTATIAANDCVALWDLNSANSSRSCRCLQALAPSSFR